jgi:hypothetical protein
MIYLILSRIRSDPIKSEILLSMIPDANDPPEWE